MKFEQAADLTFLCGLLKLLCQEGLKFLNYSQLFLLTEKCATILALGGKVEP